MENKCKITVIDEVNCLIQGLKPQHHETLFNEFGIYVDGYFFMRTFKMGHWDGKIRFYTKTGKTFVRLLDKILPFIDKWDYDIELIDKRSPLIHPVLTCKSTKLDESGMAVEAEGTHIFGDIRLPNGKLIELRPYQVQCLEKLVEAGSGFVIAATGSGKSLITAALSKTYGDLGHKVITIVPSDDLVTQTYSWYKLCGLDVGRYSGTNKELDHLHVVATWQSLQYNPNILNDYGCVIFDESHGLKAAVAQKLLNEHASNAPFRFGVTGTFPKHPCDQMALFTAMGPILCEVKARWLMDNNYLAKVEIQPVVINESYIEEEFPDYDSEKSFISKSPHRLEKIADLIISECATHGNTLVLVNSIPFGKKLSSLIKNSVFLFGESDSDLRKEHYDMFEKNDDIILIASVGIASTGISIDRIFCLALVDPGKSFIRAIQSIGRGLRRAGDKENVHVVDIHSKLKWARKHFNERAKFYREAEYPILKKLTLKVTAE